MGEGQATAALIAALVLFAASTRQFSLWVRALLLIAAVGLLICSGLQIAGVRDYSILQLAVDAWTYRAEPSQSVLAIALRGNSALAAGHIVPLLDLFFVLTALLGAVAVLSLTPGERVERIVRPLLYAAMGAIAGAALALSLVVIGFGGVVKHRTFVGLVADRDVHDGDSISMGDVALRLYGIDAPELHQPCFQDSQARCGADSREHLAALAAGAIIQCVPANGETDDAPPETFGRPVVRCYVRRAGRAPVDLSAQMLRDGYAIRYRTNEYAADEAAGRTKGLCFVRPEQWRRNHQAAEPLVGSCAANSGNPH